MGTSTTDIGLLFDYSIVFLFAGIPYWYYRWFHPNLSTDAELGNNYHSELRDHWVKVAREVPDVWNTHKPIVGVALAVTFPLISVSPLPKCSWAYIFAIVSLVYGLITLIICVVHKVYIRGIDDHNLPTSWYITPGGGFFRRDVVRFYIFLSLPSIWLAGFISSFAITLFMVATGVLTSDERSEVDHTASSALCSNLKFLLAVVPPIIVIAATTGARSIKYARQSLHDEQLQPLVLNDLAG